MKPNKCSRLCRWGLACILLLPLLSQAQISQGSYIIITLQDEYYNCSTGKQYVKFNISHYDQWGNQSFGHVVYSIRLGTASRVVGRSLPGGNADVWFEGAYNIGDLIECEAQGISNSDAPTTFYTFTPTPPAPPAKPLISSNASLPLCNGSSAFLSVGGNTLATYVWSNGMTGNTISVTAPGSYTVHEVGECGVSAESDPFVITAASTPSAPIIGSSNGTLLCNGQSTTLGATSSGGMINWSTGATGTSVSTNAPGVYYASETNGCGTSGNSNVITISTNNTPQPPSVSSSNGTSLCNGETTTLTAAPTAGGAITWNTGATGGSITVSSPGSYYAYESNSCGSSANSNVIVISTGSVPAAPSISSSNATLLCNGGSTVLSASGGGSITWNTGAVAGSIGVSSAGTYYAVASNNCGTSGASNSITISTAVTPAAPSVSSSGGTLLCNGASTTLSASPSYGGSIRWNTGAAGNTLSVSSAGNYYAYEANGCGNGSNSNTITVSTLSTPAAPSVSPSGNQLLCNGASVTISSNGSNVLWSTGATGNSITVSNAGSYYTIDRNACGNSSASNTVNVTTVVCPTPLPGSSFSVCPGTLKTLDAGAGYDTYEWSNGATTRTVSVGPGTYTVTVSKSGCFATSAAVTVGYYTVVTPTVSASGTTTFCAGGSVTLNASTGNAYSWNTSATTSSINVTGSGSYYVTVTDGNGCTATSSALNVTVNALPSASVSGNASVCQNAASPSIVFTGSGGVAPYTFVYRINGGTTRSVSTSSDNNVSVAVPTTSAGSYVYSLVSVQESSSTSCSNTASGSATVTIGSLPTASVSGTTNVCRNSSSPQITFSASGGNGPYTFTYRINGGANQVVSTSTGNSVSISAPTSSTGSFVYSLVSVQEAGSCLNSASGTATVTINELPTATISGSATVCKGATSPLVTFTGSGGIAPYTFTYRVNGGSTQTITTVSGNSVALPVPTATAGDQVYELISVSESSGTSCSSNASGSVTIHINQLPTATISGNTSICRNAPASSILFTGSGGTAPYTFGYRINGGSLQTITTSSGNSVSVSVPSSAAGSFAYSLVSVQEAGATACSAPATGTATVTVNPLPTAMIAGSSAVCQNGSSPVISFTGASGTAPYTFVYRVNGGTEQTVTSTGNTATITVPVSAAGSFTYSLVRVQDASATACEQSVGGSATIVVNPQPVKAVNTTTNTHLCNGETAVLKVGNFVSGYTYSWFKNGVLIRTTNKDTIQVNTAGSYTVLPVSAEGCAAAANSDAIIITTGAVTTPVITGSVKVCEGGKTLLTALTAARKPYDTWSWTVPPGDPRRDPPAILGEDSSFFAPAGQYRVRVSAQGCADSVSVVVTSDDTEYPAGRLTIQPNVLSFGDKAVLSAEVTGAVSFRWDIGDNKKITTSGNALSHNYYQSGDSIPVKVWATSARNCTSLFSSFVSVKPMIPDTLPDHSFAGRVRDWNVFPIPFTTQVKITVVLKRAEQVRFDLFSAEGKWLRNWQFKAVKGDNLFVLEGLETLASGAIYHVTSTYNGELHTEKIIKQ